MKTMTPEQRAAKNLRQQAYRARVKAAKAAPETQGLPTREESDAARAMTEDHAEPLPPVLDPAKARRAPRRASADLPVRVFAARIPHADYDRIKALCKIRGESQLAVILAGIALLEAK